MTEVREEQERTFRDWELWSQSRDYLELLRRRSTGEEPEMECAKHLRRLIEPIFRPGMRMLDVGCSTAHYFRTLSKLPGHFEYFGIDNGHDYIRAGADAYRGDAQVHLAVGDLYALPFPSRFFGVVFCFNVLPNLPDFRTPLGELLRVTRSHLFVRMLIGAQHQLVRDPRPDLSGGGPLRYEYHHTSSFDELRRLASTVPGCAVEFLEDDVDLRALPSTPNAHGTYVQDGVQYLRGIRYEWRVLHVTRHAADY